MKPTLAQELEQFLYTHAPQMAHKKTLLSIVKKWEDAYQARIDELENVPLVEEFNRMVDEGGPAGEVPALEPEYDDSRGNRFDDYLD